MTDKKDELAISVKDITKTFKLPHEKLTSVKGMFVKVFRRKRTFERQVVLKDISFEVKKGEFFGIVGRNGSGKSTLLKVMAGIYEANGGHVKINGKLVPFIELGVGFNPELTGRENVYLNGALLGISRKEMDELYDEIVEFAELEPYMDQYLKNYSSGMQVRLAFSIAIRAKGDILLLDEVLAVGDAAFQKKCLIYFSELKRDHQTVVLVTHDMNSVERFCNRAMLIEQGEIKITGNSSDVARYYDEMFLKDEIKKESDETESNGDIYKDDKLEIVDIHVAQNDKKTEKIKAFKPFKVHVELKSKVDAAEAYFGMYVKNSEGRVVVVTDTQMHDGLWKLTKDKTYKFEFEVDNILTNGMYRLFVTGNQAMGKDNLPLIVKRPFGKFTVSGVERYRDAFVHPKVTMKVDKK